MENLSSLQNDIFNKYLNGENIFISGPGGSGKTYLIKQIVNHAKFNGKQCQVCALTGCAAILLECNATTLHSFAGIGLANGTVNQVVDKVTGNKKKRANWNKTKILIIDEVSMLSSKLFNIIDLIAKRVKKERDKPFGGMQIIFSGDFYQLPPVGEENDPETLKFCFESDNWNETFSLHNQIILEKVFRQTDEKYAKILNKLRVGKITKSGIDELKKCVNKKIDESSSPTIILPRRKDAEKINNDEFSKLKDNEERIYKVSLADIAEMQLNKEQIAEIELLTYNKTEVEFEFEYLSNNLMVDKEIKLKIGSQVMCVCNLNVEGTKPIVNGSQGIVIAFKNNFPVVKFNNDLIQTITPHIWQSERIPNVGVKQIPLIYSWAITIHKAQGITLDQALIDIGKQVFECGQTYVALSRVKSLEGLYLKDFDYNKIKVNNKVKLFYEKLINHKA